MERALTRTAVLALVLSCVALTVFGAVPQAINVQGKLTDAGGSPVADGLHTVVFTIWNASLGGGVQWADTINVTTSGGLFSVNLGESSPIPYSVFATGNLWLGIKVGADPEMTPRQKLASTPFTMSSYVAPGSIGSTEIADSAIGFNHIGQNGAASGQVMKWNGSAWTAANDSISVVNSVMYADSATHADASDSSAFADSTGAITNGAVDFSDIGQNGAASGQVMKWNGSAWVTSSIGSAEITDNSIMNADINSGAAISASKINGTAATLSANQTFTGTNTFNKINYSTPRTHYFMVGGEGFLPASNVAYSNSYGNGGAYLNSGSGAMAAPVHLPQGAVVTALKVFFYDASASDVSVNLQRLGLSSGGYGTLAFISSSGTPGYSSLIDSTPSSSPINNLAYSYHIRAYSTGWTGNTLRVMGALITYTISEAP